MRFYKWIWWYWRQKEIIEEMPSFFCAFPSVCVWRNKYVCAFICTKMAANGNQESFY